MRATNIPIVHHQYTDQGRDGIPQIGAAGDTLAFKAAVALNVGELVYISADDTVSKSAVAATVAAAPIGVVFTGIDLNFGTPQAYTPSGVPSYQAAAAGGQVYVQYDGVALVYCTGAVAAGGTVIPAGVAGQVVAGSTAGQIVGFAVKALAGAGWVLIKLEHR